MSWASVSTALAPLYDFHSCIANHIVRMFWDEEAEVWCAICDTIPLALEGDNYDALVSRARIAAPEMLKDNGLDDKLYYLSFVVCANGSLRKASDRASSAERLFLRSPR